MNHFRSPSLSDKRLDYESYNNMIHQSKKLSNLRFDPTQFNVMEDSTGIYVSSSATSSNAAAFTHHFITSIANAAAGTYYIDTGYWDRNGEEAIWTNVAPIDPINTEYIITNNYTGTVYNYVVRRSSGGNTVPQTPLEIVTCADGTIESHNQMKMAEAISSVDYVDGEITGISQYQVGSIADNLPMCTDFEEFGINIVKNDKYTVGFSINGGDIRRRDKVHTVSGVGMSTFTADKAIYIDLGIDDTTKDVSLIPVTPSIKIEDYFPTEPGYTNRFIKLYALKYHDVAVAGDGSAADKYADIEVVRYFQGSMKDDWVRPDGKDCGVSYVDNAKPKVKSIDFVTTDDLHEGELQEYQAHEQLALKGAGVSVVDITGDQVIAYFDYKSGNNSIDKKYARIDAVNADARGTGFAKSLEINGNKNLQIYNFACATGTAITDATTESPSPYLIMARSDSGTVPEVAYLDISAMKVADAGHADGSDYANVAGVANTVSNFLHTDLTFTGSSGGISGGNTDHDDSYMVTGEMWDQNACQSIGRSSIRQENGGYTQAINLTNSQLYDSIGSDYSVDWDVRTLRKGSNVVINWDNSGTDWKIEFSATNKWDSTDFIINVDTDISLTAGNSASISTTKEITLGAGTNINLLASGKLTASITDAINISTSSNCKLSWVDGVVWDVGNWGVTPVADDTNYYFLGGDRKWKEILLSATTLYLTSDQIMYGLSGVQGVSIANWSTSGAITGTDIQEINAIDMLSTDKVLVRR